MLDESSIAIVNYGEERAGELENTQQDLKIILNNLF
jgi:hypothetical protein